MRIDENDLASLQADALREPSGSHWIPVQKTVVFALLGEVRKLRDMVNYRAWAKQTDKELVAMNSERDALKDELERRHMDGDKGRFLIGPWIKENTVLRAERDALRERLERVAQLAERRAQFLKDGYHAGDYEWIEIVALARGEEVDDKTCDP